MKVNNVVFDKDFVKEYKSLPKKLKIKVKKSLYIFKNNPFHPSLRLHKLSGKLTGIWSISINRRYRILFKVKGEGDILLVSVGTHAIYD